MRLSQTLCRLALIAGLSCGVVASVPSSAWAAPGQPEAINDPLEGINRYTFAFNEAVDMVVLRPVAEVYSFLLPQYGQDRIRNILRNLRGPLIFVNQILQGDVTNATETLGRFLVNSTIGVVGIWDVATDWGLPYRNADFGQTFGKWGIGSGPYLILPILGPSSIRDAVGLVGDYYGDPVNITLWNSMDDDDANTIIVSRAVISAVDTRARLIKTIDDLRKNSLDYYATVRSVYSQRRAADIQGETEANIPDYSNNPN